MIRLELLFVLACLFLMALAFSNNERPIALNISSHIAYAPATIRILVRVHPLPTDRLITVGIDNGDFRRVSEWTIEPDRTLYDVLWKDLPAGDYDVEGLIGGYGQIRATATDRVNVIAP